MLDAASEEETRERRRAVLPFTFRLMRRLMDPPSETGAATMGVAPSVRRFDGYTSMSVLRKECVRRSGAVSVLSRGASGGRRSQPVPQRWTRPDSSRAAVHASCCRHSLLRRRAQRDGTSFSDRTAGDRLLVTLALPQRPRPKPSRFLFAPQDLTS
jgi:hypothetical protein